MRTTNFDSVAAAAPLNREASSVRDGSGEIYDKARPGFAGVPRWAAPPALKDPRTFQPDGRKLHAQMAGRRFGRLVVLGVWAETNPKKPSTWVCRCDCGYYEGRKARTLFGESETATACSHCLETERLRALAKLPNTSKARKDGADLLDRIASEAGR